MYAAKVAGKGPPAPPGPAQRSGEPATQQLGFSVPAVAPDRLTWMGNVLVGYRVEAQVRSARGEGLAAIPPRAPAPSPAAPLIPQLTSGSTYEGVFSGLRVEPAGVSAVLKFAKPVYSQLDDRNALAEKPVPLLAIPAGELMQIFAKDVRLSPEDLAGADRSDVGFETDAAISRGRGG
jgi:hypothetical protein